jgi:adapter protein MecA 1/2
VDVIPKDFLPDGADEVLDLFQKLLEQRLKNTPQETREQQTVELANELDMRRLYLFPNLEQVIEASHVLKDIYHGENLLFKNPETGEFHLIISKSDHTPEEFNKVCNILSEYAGTSKYTASNEAYMREHYTQMLGKQALQQLAEI